MLGVNFPYTESVYILVYHYHSLQG